MKKIISLILILTLMVITYIHPVSGQSDQIIDEKINEKILARGVTLQNIRRFTTKGWLNINVVKVDLEDPEIDLDALFDPRGIGHTTNLLNMSKGENIVASINTDFFSVVSKPSYIAWPVGTAINDGEIISTHGYTEDKFSTFVLTTDNKPLFLFWNTAATITAPSGVSAPIYLINKYYSDWINYSIILFDKNWGARSVGNEGVYTDTTEIVVENSIVKEIRKDLPGVEIPENGYVLSAVRSKNAFLDNYFSVGETVQLNIHTIIDLNSVKTAVGGGTLLLKDGQRAPNTWKQSGRNPYSALGTDQNNKYLYLVTVDGRQAISMGMSQDELAQFMQELGCYNAIQFDGGGSTTMTARLPGDGFLSVVNIPSDGGLRSISEGLGIISNAPRTELQGLIIESNNVSVFANTSCNFVVKGYDSNYNPVPINNDEIVWSVEGVAGHFNKSVFYPSTAGEATVYATYRGVTGSYPIKVLDMPFELTITPTIFSGDAGKSYDISVTGKDKNGYFAPISVNDVNWTFENDIAEISNNKLVIKKSSTGLIKASVGNAYAYAGITSQGTIKIIDGFETANGSFSGYPVEVTGEYTLSSETVKQGNYSGSLSFDFTADIASSKAAYFKLNNPITIGNDVTKIGLWVYSQSLYSHGLKAYLTDSNGNVVRLDLASNLHWDGWRYLEASMPPTASYPLKLERIYVVQTDQTIKDKGTIYFDELSFVYKSPAGIIQLPENSKYNDPLNTPAKTTDGSKPFRFMVFGKITEPKTLIDKLIISQVVSKANSNSDMVIFTGLNNHEAVAGLNVPYVFTKGYSAMSANNNLFIWIDTSNNGIRETDTAQWSWLKAQLSNNQSKHVFLFSPSPIDGEGGFKDYFESELLKETISKQLVEQQGKTPFVFYNGVRNDMKIENGVRYISAAGMKNTGYSSILNRIQNTKYILVTVTDDSVTYEFKNLFE